MNENVTSDFLAKLFGLSTRRIQQLVKEKVIEKSENGKYKLPPSVKGYINSL